MVDALPPEVLEYNVNESVDSNVEALLNIPFHFSRQPSPIPPNLRPERRVPLTLLLVAKCHGSGASWKSLQLLNWIVRDARHAELVSELRGRRDISEQPVIRFEPALDRALDIAVGFGFLEQKSSRVFRLTDAGRRIVELLSESEAFSQERAILQRLHGKLTATEVARLIEWRTS